MRGFLTTPIERAVSAISGVDYIESTSRAGVSTVTVRLKLNHSSTAALAEVTARLQQVRSELPAEAEPPVVEVQRADRPYASFYLSFSSSDARHPARSRTGSPARSSRSSRRCRACSASSFEGARQLAMRVWIDPDRLAALGLAPGDVHAALRRNNYLAAVGQTKGNLVQVNLLANTDLRSVEGVRGPHRRRPRRRDRAPERRRDGRARRRRGRAWSPSTARRRPSTSACGRSIGANEIEVAHRLRAEMERIAPTLPPDIEMQLAYDATIFMEDALKEITKTLTETILIVGARRVPVHGLDAHGARAARRDADLAHRRGARDVRGSASASTC